MQRAPVTTKPKRPAIGANSYVDLVKGLHELLVAADSNGARGLYVPKFGRDLSRQHRALLERVRRVLIKAQADTKQRREAVAEWPRLVTKLNAAIAEARRVGLTPAVLDTTLENLDTVGENYVYTGGSKSAQEAVARSYFDYAKGVAQMVDVISPTDYDRTTGVIRRDIHEFNRKQRTALRALRFGDGLNDRHRALLEQLRETLVLAYTSGSAKRALAEWKNIGGDVFTTFEKASKHLQTTGETRSYLVDIGQKLIYGGAYSEAHNAALAKVDLKSPTLAFEVERVKAAAKDLIAAKDIIDKAAGVMTGGAIDRALTKADVAVPPPPNMTKALKSANIGTELGAAIWDIAKNPGEVWAKAQEFNKRGVGGRLVTVADIAEKMLALRNAIYKVALTAVQEFAKGQLKAAVAKGITEAAERWKGVGEWAGRHLDTLAKVGKVAGVISIAVSVIKVFDALIKGDWGAALQEAGSTALGLAAGAAGGAAGAITVGGIGIIIAAQAEAFSGAAAMIRYCKQANVREAALDFIHVCQAAADLEAKSLIADAKLLDDPDLADQRKFIQARLQSHVQWWVRHVGEMKALLYNQRANAIGGQPALRKALGAQTISALVAPVPTTFDGLGKQIATVFTGANSMSEFVVKKYPRTSAG